MSYFLDTVPYIEGNKKLRLPQIEAYSKIRAFFLDNPSGEALVVLPTGTGKSGLISIAPFGVCKTRVLVITPGIVTKKSVVKALHPLEDNFWINYDVLFSVEDIPVVEEYEPDMLMSSLEKCDFVIANVHKLYKLNPKSLINVVKPDFFDMVIVDEAHHSAASTWKDALEYFASAKKLHVTGTPYRGDNLGIPGEIIHKTKLSEAMTLKYVKLLRKATVNNHNMYFTMRGGSKKHTKEEILEYKDTEWITKSVALSKECSEDVINESINKLSELRSCSPKVPHKILAVACSIAHAEDVARWYEEKGKAVVIVHSSMTREEVEQNLLKIDNDECDVVVSVNMLMEGYDHKYLTILAIFRPYRSRNAFAQIVGRVLRTIPESEITDFAIDNNAYVIFHEEIGLNDMWEEFASEVDNSKKHSPREYDINDREYTEREVLYAGIETGECYVTEAESYLPDVDFNKMFEDARKAIQDKADQHIEKLINSGFTREEAEEISKNLVRKETKNRKSEFDALLYSKRPEMARKILRSILNKDVNESAQSILEEKNIDPKGYELCDSFRRLIPTIPSNTMNDGVIVIYINKKLYAQFGPVKDRDPEKIAKSQMYLSTIIEELRSML